MNQKYANYFTTTFPMGFLAILLLPFSAIYDLVTRFRNHLYNIGYKSSFSFQTNVIAVGNLSVGGTGKTPMVEYIIRLLSEKFQITTLSRGYGRKTKGYIMATSDDSASSIGDEPYQFYHKFQKIHVAVCEDRALGIPFILGDRPNTEIIILDDAFQHRSVKPQLNIMLTDYKRPFYDDFVLPSGRLRESRRGSGRADIIVVTKCPEGITHSEMDVITQKIKTYNYEAAVFFAGIKYGSLTAFKGSSELKSTVTAFSGIAKPQPFIDHLKAKYSLTAHIDFKDHYDYTIKDIQKLLTQLDQNSSLVTTEKDMVKLLQPTFREYLSNKSVYYLPIETYFIKDGKRFDAIIQNSISEYSN
ncbi:MAG: tetraacyldisaccharide 4'-kinase [Bacteroidota bacterium]